MAGYRPEYTEDEESKIVNFIIEKGYVHRIKGDKIWKEMADEKIVDRTWHSLKQHFRKTMIYQLHFPRYNLDKETVAWFRKVFNKEHSIENKQTSIGRQKTSGENSQRNRNNQNTGEGGSNVTAEVGEGHPKYPDFLNFEDSSSSDTD